MALAGAGQDSDVAQMLTSMEQAAADQHDGGTNFRDVDCCHSALSLPRVMRDGNGVVDLLAPLRYRVYRIGGEVTRSAISSPNCSSTQQLPMGGMIWRAL